jgi:hypothetical protein
VSRAATRARQKDVRSRMKAQAQSYWGAFAPKISSLAHRQALKRAPGAQFLAPASSARSQQP